MLQTPESTSEWKVTDDRPPLPVFCEVSGVRAPVHSGSSLLDCFEQFFSRDIVKIIKSNTNRYAASSLDKMTS